MGVVVGRVPPLEFKPRLKPEGVKAYEAMRYLADAIRLDWNGDQPSRDRISKRLFEILDQ